MIQKLLILAAACSSMAFAETPILTKTSATGSAVNAEYAKSQSCSLYAGKVVTTMTYALKDGTTTSATQEFPVTLQSNFMALVDQAMTDTVSTSANDTCGNPTTTVSAGNGTMIFDSGGCGKPHFSRTGGASSSVMDFIGMYCSKTYN